LQKRFFKKFREKAGDQITETRLKDTTGEHRFFKGIQLRRDRHDELRLLFILLQLGAILNAGEKLHAMKGDVRNFVFDRGKNHPFFKRVQIPRRRYARETVFAQICINSFYRSLQGSFYRARYEDLQVFFDQYKSLKMYQDELHRINTTLEILNRSFDRRAEELENRASIVSGYLFVEELVKNDKRSEVRLFVEFYMKFLAEVKKQALKGLDYNPRFRRLLDFQTYITQAAVEKSAIEGRTDISSQVMRRLGSKGLRILYSCEEDT
jgi:hypothetical protein